MSGISPGQAATVTPGQAAYEAWHAKLAERHPVARDLFPWDHLDTEPRDEWDTAAQAAIKAAPPGSERVAELVTEGNELRRLVDEILTARRVADALGIERVATLRAKAGLQTEPAVAFAGTEPVCPRCGTASCLEDASFGAAVVTAGTEHLAEKIRGLAIPDEES